MTLCIAWQQQDNIYFGADSRLSYDNAEPIDTCAKIVRVPVSVRTLGDGGTTERLTLGLAIAGNFVTAYTVREILFELLERFQVVPGRVDPSMDTLARIVAEVFEAVSRQVCNALFEKGMAALLVGGYCLRERRVRIFRIATEIQDSLAFRTDEVDVRQPMFLGAGAPRAERLAIGRESHEMPVILRSVIRDEAEPSVGGPMQFGKFDGRDFSLFGVQEVEEKEHEVTVRYLFRGILAGKLLDQIGLSFAHFHTQFIAPFSSEIDQAADRKKLVVNQY